tara:strand:- start:1022 stop:1519 length:498 start_codon:yes stop_codon:yes gene_type:complete
VSEGVIFSGHGICTADGKGRFALPLGMRKDVKHSSRDANKLFISLHHDQDCALGYGIAQKEWLEAEILADQQAARGRGEPFDVEATRSHYFPGLDELNFDDGGRFFMPDDIKDMLGFGDAIVFVGNGRNIQMWAPQKYLEYPHRNRRVVYAVEKFLAEQAAGAGK